MTNHSSFSGKWRNPVSGNKVRVCYHLCLRHTIQRAFVLHIISEIARFIVKKKVQVGKDQEKAQSEKDSHSKNRGGKKPN